MAESKKLEVRLTPAEWSAVDYLAQQLHLTRSSLVRFALAELAQARAIRYGAESPPAESHRSP